MKPFLYTILFLIGFEQGLFPQVNKVNSGKFNIHTMPLTMFDYTPRYRLGVEYNTGDKLAYNIDFGIGSYTLNQIGINHLHWEKAYSFYEIRPEIKYYFFKPTDYLSFYSGAELFYIQMYDVLGKDYYYPEISSKKTDFDKATYNKYKLGLHAKGGIELVAFKKIQFDFYAGFGAAYRDIEYSNLLNPRSGDTFLQIELPHSYRHEGKSLIAHTTLGCKIGFNFR